MPDVFKDGKKYFYGGYITTNGDINVDTVDKVLDIIERYEELVEVEDADSN